ncbi:hypothetical protein HY404_00565 [Candidatus Microgenomates bacterium]|nr:hypothetical protein [Candidatus Microgenomates bacterium]
MALTQNDLIKIQEIVQETVKVEVKQELDDINEKINHLPTKKEFYDKMDELIGDLETRKIEYEVGLGQVSDKEERIAALEEIHPKASIFKAKSAEIWYN